MKKITAGDERRENGQQLDGTPEMRVWQAVIASTVEEWVHGPLRSAREAEQCASLRGLIRIDCAQSL